MQDQKQNLEEEYEEMSPRLLAYIREVEEGREPIYGPFKTREEMWEHALGPDWRKYFKNADAVSNEQLKS